MVCSDFSVQRVGPRPPPHPGTLLDALLTHCLVSSEDAQAPVVSSVNSALSLGDLKCSTILCIWQNHFYMKNKRWPSHSLGTWCLGTYCPRDSPRAGKALGGRGSGLGAGSPGLGAGPRQSGKAHPRPEGVMRGVFRGSPALGRRLPIVGGAIGSLPLCVLFLSWVFSVWCPGARAARPRGSQPRLRQTSVKQTEDRTW